MVAFLAALPAIFSAVGQVSELFDVGKKVIEEVTGEPSSSVHPEDLKREYENLPPDQQEVFVNRMRAELDLYTAITHRLEQQGGRIDAGTLNAIPERQRGAIAKMRMTTRPWAVRWMVIAVVFPPLATVATNLLLSIYNALDAAFAEHPNQIALIALDGVLNDLYTNMIGWAAGVIMTYMGMREVGKAVGQKDSVSVADITGSVGGFVSSVKNIFGK
ncbi:hypothetical protein [Terasakiella sp.]|uniref:hypothetical protein n=1 Tax=Terasakiella sp. TaxID=2034861 RepID=UPI003AA8C416